MISAFGVVHEVSKGWKPPATRAWGGPHGKRGIQRGIQQRWEKGLDSTPYKKKRPKPPEGEVKKSCNCLNAVTKSGKMNAGMGGAVSMAKDHGHSMEEIKNAMSRGITMARRGR